MRRDFGDRSRTLELVEEPIGRAITVRAAHRSPAPPHVAVEKSEPVEVGRSAPERVLVGRGSEAHSKETLWPVRSTLLLIVSVGVLFWGAGFWIIFG